MRPDPLELRIEREGLVAVLMAWGATVDVTRGDFGCWLWTLTPIGVRGSFAGKTAPAAAWRLLRGRIPNGLWVLHHCPEGDRGDCVNPSHLHLGTHSHNQHDRVSRSRYVDGVRVIDFGYTDEQEEQAFELCRAGLISTEIAVRMHLPYSTVLYILSGGPERRGLSGRVANTGGHAMRAKKRGDLARAERLWAERDALRVELAAVVQKLNERKKPLHEREGVSA